MLLKNVTFSGLVLFQPYCSRILQKIAKRNNQECNNQGLGLDLRLGNDYFQNLATSDYSAKLSDFYFIYSQLSLINIQIKKIQIWSRIRIWQKIQSWSRIKIWSKKIQIRSIKNENLIQNFVAFIGAVKIFPIFHAGKKLRSMRVGVFRVLKKYTFYLGRALIGSPDDPGYSLKINFTQKMCNFNNKYVIFSHRIQTTTDVQSENCYNRIHNAIIDCYNAKFGDGRSSY